MLYHVLKESRAEACCQPTGMNKWLYDRLVYVARGGGHPSLMKACPCV